MTELPQDLWALLPLLVAQAPLDAPKLRISGPCVPRGEILHRHEHLEIVGHPRGGSFDEESTWSRRERWGSLAFGFAERHPDCLGSAPIAGPAWRPRPVDPITGYRSAS